MQTPSFNNHPPPPTSICVDLAAAHLESDFRGFVILGLLKNSTGVVVDIRTEDSATASQLFDALGETLFPLDGSRPFTSGPDDEEEDADGDDVMYVPIPTPIVP